MKEEKDRDIKPVSFSLIDEYEKKLYKFATHTDHGPFSRYVKRLISKDMEGWQYRQTKTEIVEKSVNYVDKDAMKSFF